MAYTYTLDTTTPADPDLISAGAGKIRALTLSLSERLASIFVNVNNDPLVFKGFSQSTGTAALNTVTVASGLTVSAGTTAVQALTGTTGAFTLNQNATTAVTVNNSNTVSSASRAEFRCVSGTVSVGVTAINGLGGFIGTADATDLVFVTGGNSRLTLNGTTGDFAINGSKFTVTAASGNTVIAGSLSMTTATSQIIPGSTGLSIRNHANGADNVFVTDAGAMIVEASITSNSGNINAGVAVNAGTVYKVATVQVLGPRITGWTAATGTPTRSTFATGSVTLSTLAEHVKALIDDFMTHGAIGT